MSRKEASGLRLLARVLYTQGVRGSSPLPPTIPYNRQNSQVLFLKIVRRYREGIAYPSLSSCDPDLLYEALNERPSFRKVAAIEKLEPTHFSDLLVFTSQE